jgi:Fuc2NAc and GlcNAc transferase
MLIIVVAFLLSVAITRLAITYAQKRGLRDIPNSRSIHKVPTPRGGGISIVAVVAGWGYFAAARDYKGAVLGALAIAAVGWWDDHRPLRASVRLAVHFAAAAFFAYGVFGITGQPELQANPFVAGLWLLALVWMTNLYNFMDGIDGIAGAECAFAALTIGLLCSQNAGTLNEGRPFFILAAASLGFLVFNWQPARIFMGDVASGFIGFFLSALSFIAITRGSIRLPALLIVLGAFIVDATWTLLVRLSRGQNPAQAHRDHAYQRAVLRGHSHRRVVSFELLVNVLWLAPLAALSEQVGDWGWACLAVAYLPLVGVARRFGAGSEA